MNNQKKINTIKARLLLGETVDDQEMLSYAINALDKSDINYKWFLKALKKPLSKQSNILLLELYRVTLNNSNFEMAKRLKNSNIINFENCEHEIFMEKDEFRLKLWDKIEKFLNS